LLVTVSPKRRFEYAQYEAVRDVLPEWFRDPTIFAHSIPWRKENVLELQWTSVDTVNWTVRAEAGETKNDEAIEIALDGEALEMMQRRWANRAITRPDGTTEICRFVFHRDGKPINKDIRDVWRAACIKAGIGKMVEVEKKGKKKIIYQGKYFHDFRRTGVRNLVKSGTPEKITMTISGHKTRAVFDRYHIVDNRGLKQAAQRQTAYMKDQADLAKKVVQIKAVKP
jgi:hypothetical protein